MKRSLQLLFVLTLLTAIIPASSAMAGSGSRQRLTGDGISLTASYGSTERDAYTSLINYVHVQVTMPGFRVGGSVCPTVYIYSQNQLRYQANSCTTFLAGATAATQGWYVYQPPANSRVQVRRGQSEIRLGFSSSYVSWFHELTCGGGTGLCGTEWMSLPIQ